MFVWILIIVATLIQMDSTGAHGVQGIDYVGCYAPSKEWQTVLGKDEVATTVDDCVNLCKGRNKFLAVIAIGTCYCSDSVPEKVSKVIDSYCNFRCYNNPCQKCGSRRHYSIYNTTEWLLSSRSSWNFDCEWIHSQTKCSLHGECEQNTFSYGPETQTTGQPISTAETTTQSKLEQGEERDCSSCQSQPVWLRIAIEVAVVIGILSLVHLTFFIYSRCRKVRDVEQSPTEEQRNRTANTSNPREAYQRLIVNSMHQNIHISSNEEHHPEDRGPQLDMTSASAKDSGMPANFKQSTGCAAPSTTEGCDQHAEGYVDEHDLDDVDADQYIPMDKMSRICQNVGRNPTGKLMLDIEDGKRSTTPSRFNYENHDVW